MKQAVSHPLKTLDNWWIRVTPDRRLDRGAANICMLIGLVVPTLGIVLIGTAPSSVAITIMPEWLQIWMCAFIFGGCCIKLHGAFCGMRWYFPRAQVKHCYVLGCLGAPLASTGLFVYAFYTAKATPTWVSAMSAVLTGMLGLGIALQAFFYWLEWRRIEHNEQVMIAVIMRN